MKQITYKDEEDVSLPPEDLAAATTLASCGIHFTTIADALGLSPYDLYGVHADGLDKAADCKAKHTVHRSLYEMAASHKNSAATLFWAKSFGYPATTPPPPSNKPEKEKPYVWNPNDPNDRVRFRVYNNDHEPNHDY